MDQVAKGESVVINKTSPNPPEIQIIIGSVAVGFYIIFLIKGQTHTEIGRGSSNNPGQRFPIGKPSVLAGCKVSWQIGIASATDAADIFTATVILTQDGNTLTRISYPPGHGDDLIVDYVTLN